MSASLQYYGHVVRPSVGCIAKLDDDGSRIFLQILSNHLLGFVNHFAVIGTPRCRALI